MTDPTHELPDSGELPSRSQKKRDALDVLSLAQQLLETPDAVLDALPLITPLKPLIDKVRSIRAHVARKRELQFLAKQLRQIDSDAIEAHLADWQGEQAQIRHRQHRIDAWRHQLIEAGVPAVNQLCAHDRSISRPAFIDLIRQIRALPAPAEGTTDERYRALSRKLYEQLKVLDEHQPLPDPDH